MSGCQRAGVSALRNISGQHSSSIWTCLHKKVIKKLRDLIKGQLPVLFTRHGDIDKATLDALTHAIMQGSAPQLMQRGLQMHAGAGSKHIGRFTCSSCRLQKARTWASRVSYKKSCSTAKLGVTRQQTQAST